jgi:hypothetical protein
MSKPKLTQRSIPTSPPFHCLGPDSSGPGHLATTVVSPDDLARTDSFILLTDDHLNLGERPVDDAHRASDPAPSGALRKVLQIQK